MYDSETNEETIVNWDDFGQVDEIDETASITDAPPPPAPGAYALKLALVEKGSKDKAVMLDLFPEGNVQAFEVQGIKHLMIVLDMQLLDSNGESIGRSNRIWASTLVGRNVKTSQVDTFLQKLGIRSQGMNVGQKVKALYDAIAGGRDTLVNKVEIDWVLVERDGHQQTNRRGNERKVFDTFLRGQSRFPSVQVGNTTVYKPLDADPKSGAPAVTRWEIRKYL